MQELFDDKIHFFKVLSMSGKPRLHQLKIITSTRSTVQASLTAWMFPFVRGNTTKEGEISYLRYVAFSPSDHYEACFTSIIWNRQILLLAVQSLTRAFCSWSSCRGSIDWLMTLGVLLGRWWNLLLFAWCLHSECLLWCFSFFLWRFFWSSLQNSTSLHFLLDSQLVVSGCVPAASISSLLWWLTVALFLWSYTVYCWIFLCSHWITITFLSCLLWKLIRFLWSSFDTPQVPQL